MSASISVVLLGYADTQDIPVVVSVLDAELETVAGPSAIFVSERPLFEVDPGDYMVRVEPASGEILRQIVTVGEKASATVEFNMYDLSGHETLAQIALLDGVDHQPESSGLDGDEYQSAWVKLWLRESTGEWRLAPFSPKSAWQSADGVRYEFNLSQGAHLLQLGGPRVAWRHVALPSGPNVTVVVLPDHDREGELLVSANAGNHVAESLLGYMNAGNLDYASQTLTKAEKLLKGKFADPQAAAIAGYYLLRVRKLERLREWAPNLSQHFTWLPDGTIINAWQHILAGRNGDGDTHFDEAHSQLLAAVSRGLPVYTEGLRLLIDGLGLFADDPGTTDAVATLTRYGDAIDWNSKTLTFTGSNPAQPDPRPRFGLPPATAGMVFLERLELDDLVRTGFVNPETTLRFAHKPSATAVVTERGTLRLETGVTFRDPDDAATATAEPDVKPWLDWFDWRSGDKTLADMAVAARSESLRARASDPVDRLGLSTRTTNALRNAGISSVSDLVTHEALGDVRGIGQGSIEEIASTLSASGLSPRIYSGSSLR